MTRRRPTAVLALAVTAAVGLPPAVADGAAPAATTTFVLRDGDVARTVELVAAREDEGDVLLLRVEECGPRSCAAEQAVLALAAGELELGEQTAELAVDLAGRAVRVRWELQGDGVQLSGLRLRSSGAHGPTTGDTFAGRSAQVQVTVDDRSCAVRGAIGTALRVAAAEVPDDVRLRGRLACEDS